MTILPEPRRAYEPPPNSEQEGDWRWYVHPVTAERFVSVTTALDVLDKAGLLFWATGLSAKAAFAELPRLVAATIRPLCGNTRNRCEKAGRHDWNERCDLCPCDECRDCVTAYLANRHFAEKSRRADEGRRVHKHIEWWALHGSWKELESELKPYIAAFTDFVADYGLTPDSWEMSEVTVLNRKDGWAGTLDAHLRIRSGVTELADDFCARVGHVGGEVLLTADVKTREKTAEDGTPQLYPENALQTAAYRRGEVVMLRDGTELPLPATDAAAVLQLRPDGYTLRPVLTDEATYGAFLHALGLFEWLLELGPKAVQVRTFPLPEQYKRDKANRKARERRAAKKAAEAAGEEPTAPPRKRTPAKKASSPKKTTGRLTAAATTTAQADPWAVVGAGHDTSDVPF